MKETIEIEKFIKNEMKRLDYSDKSIRIYSSCILRLRDFYTQKEIEQIDFNDVRNYIKHLQSDRLNISYSLINQAFHSYILLYNRIWKRNYAFDTIVRPERTRSIPEILTTKEILTIIDSTNDIQHKLLIAISYSVGLDLSEVRNLKINDIDLNRNIIKVRDSKGKIKRNAVLAKYVRSIYHKHLKTNNPQKYLLESTMTGTKYSDTTIRNIFVNQVERIGIPKKITFKTLKYSYAAHLQELGRPLQYILEELKIPSIESLLFYSKIINKTQSNKPYSPLDKIALRTEVEHPINIEYFEQAFLTIPDKDEAEYLKEALICMNAGSLRAGIIFAWTATVINIRKKCFNHGNVSLNNALRRHNQNAKEIKKLEDFSYINDALLIKVAQELGEIDKGEKDSLEDCLDTRNKCSHPGRYRPKQLKASSVLEELISIVFK